MRATFSHIDTLFILVISECVSLSFYLCPEDIFHIPFMFLHFQVSPVILVCYYSTKESNNAGLYIWGMVTSSRKHSPEIFSHSVWII